MEKENQVEDKQQETPLPEVTKQKKGLSLSRFTVHLLEAKAKEVFMSQSEVADEVLRFGIPAFEEENGMKGKTVIIIEELIYLRSLQEPTTGPGEAVDAIPEPEPVPTKHGHREKLRVPGMNQVPGPQQISGKGDPGTPILGPGNVPGTPADGLYRPTMGHVSDPIPAQPVEQQAQPALTQHELDYIATRIATIQAMQQQYPMHPTQPGMVGQALQPSQMDVNPYLQQAQQPQQPAPPVQFAASYPPGYTGPPGVGVGMPVQQEQQGLYPYPGNQGQAHETQRQPQYMNDPYAMNIANQVAGDPNAGLTAQGLLSGSQAITPNVAQPNQNMEYAKRALGANWRQNLQSMNAANRRG